MGFRALILNKNLPSAAKNNTDESGESESKVKLQAKQTTNNELKEAIKLSRDNNLWGHHCE